MFTISMLQKIIGLHRLPITTAKPQPLVVRFTDPKYRNIVCQSLVAEISNKKYVFPALATCFMVQHCAICLIFSYHSSNPFQDDQREHISSDNTKPYYIQIPLVNQCIQDSQLIPKSWLKNVTYHKTSFVTSHWLVLGLVANSIVKK